MLVTEREKKHFLSIFFTKACDFVVGKCLDLRQVEGREKAISHYNESIELMNR